MDLHELRGGEKAKTIRSHLKKKRLEPQWRSLNSSRRQLRVSKKAGWPSPCKRPIRGTKEQCILIEGDLTANACG